MDSRLHRERPDFQPIVPKHLGQRRDPHPQRHVPEPGHHAGEPAALRVRVQAKRTPRQRRGLRPICGATHTLLPAPVQQPPPLRQFMHVPILHDQGHMQAYPGVRNPERIEYPTWMRHEKRGVEETETGQAKETNTIACGRDTLDLYSRLHALQGG